MDPKARLALLGLLELMVPQVTEVAQATSASRASVDQEDNLDSLAVGEQPVNREPRAVLEQEVLRVTRVLQVSLVQLV